MPSRAGSSHGTSRSSTYSRHAERAIASMRDTTGIELLHREFACLPAALQASIAGNVLDEVVPFIAGRLLQAECTVVCLFATGLAGNRAGSEVPCELPGWLRQGMVRGRRADCAAGSGSSLQGTQGNQWHKQIPARGPRGRSRAEGVYASQRLRSGVLPRLISSRQKRTRRSSSATCSSSRFSMR